MKRVLAALRLSDVTEESSSIERQREIIERWAEDTGHQIVGWAEDAGVSGSVDPHKRKGLGPWFDPDKIDQWDTLASAKIDRLSRSIADLSSLIAWAEKTQRGIVAVSDSIDTTTSAGRLQAHLMGVLADFELDRIKQRSQESQRHHAVRGLWHGGIVMLGYQLVGTKGNYRLAVDPATIDQARDHVQKIIDGGSINSIARERGITGATAKVWLTTPLLWGSRGAVDQDGNPILLVEGEPICDQATFDRLQAALRTRSGSRAPSVKTDGPNPLRGLLWCGCGTIMNTTNPSKDRQIYVCRTRSSWWKNRGGSNCEVNSTLKTDLVIAAVDRLMQVLDTEPEVKREWFAGDGDELSRVEKAIARLQEDRDLEVIKASDYAERMKPLVLARKRLAGSGRASGWVETPTGRTMAQAYREGTPDEARALLVAGGWSFMIKSTPRTRTLHAMRGGRQYGWTGI